MYLGSPCSLTRPVLREMVAEIIAGHKREFDKVAIPEIVFTEPEIVSVGLTPEEAREGRGNHSWKIPLAANGRALSLEAKRRDSSE